jgi:hypothetical protein
VRARRLLGRARTSLEYRSLDEVLGDLPEEMEKIQRACSDATDALAARYFPRGATTLWVDSGWGDPYGSDRAEANDGAGPEANDSAGPEEEEEA